jgi:predicted phosphoribosyltransferase
MAGQTAAERIQPGRTAGAGSDCRNAKAAAGDVLVAGALERRRATESQAGLSPHERRANVRGAFFVPRPAVVDGQDVLLIDDIYTTGATARACAQALTRAGARRVWVATVARAQREDALVGAAAVEDVEIPMGQDAVLWDAQSVQGRMES